MGFQELALLLLLFLPLCSAQSTYYVIPTPDTPCPGEPCYTLSTVDVVNNLTSDAILKFLPGNYSLKIPVTFADLNSLALAGDISSLPQVTTSIMCNQQANIFFSNIGELNFTDITLVSCGTVKLDKVLLAGITNCIFRDGQNGALSVIDSSVYLSNSKFENNSNEYHGGALAITSSYITILNNIFTNNIATGSTAGGGVFMEDTAANISGNIFIHNSAELAGGGILSYTSTVSFNSNLFMNNTAPKGGGIVVLSNSNVSVTNNTFTGNNASQNGGGIDIIGEGVVANFTGNTFEFNIAGQFGGGVNLQTSTVSFNNNLFKNNSALFGGGIEVSRNSNVSATNNTFTSNSAVGGGGVNTIGEGVIANFTGNIFEYNSAGQYSGGGVQLLFSTVIFSDNLFMGNTAIQSGGGIAVSDISTVSATNNTFTRNNAFFGGGVSIDSGVLAHFMGNTFEYNSAQISGGGIYLVNNTILSFINNLFENNTASSSGGGIAVYYNSEVSATNNTFVRNIAGSSGGGIIIVYEVVANFIGNIFENNTAEQVGGGVALSNSTADFSNNLFNNNTAGWYGGGMGLFTNGDVNATNNSFTKNIAGVNGGGIGIIGGGIGIIGVVASFMGDTFAHNTAQSRGGGVSVYNGSTVSFTLVSCLFNTAVEIGGGILVEDSFVNITESNLTGNVASQRGGGSYLGSGTVNFRKNVFIDNSALFNGAGIYSASDTNSIECTNNTFRNNWGGGWVLFIEDSDRTSALLSQNVYDNNTGNVAYGSSEETPSTYHITPLPDTLCPNEPCLTISEFIDQAGQYIALNTTLMFLPGTHTVRRSVLVEGIVSLTLLRKDTNSTSESLPLIKCDRPASLGFRYIDKLFVRSLAFESCGDGTYAAFNVKSVSSVEISDCSFKNNIGSGGAVVITNCNMLLINNNVFEKNSAVVGGGLYVNESTINFIGNTFVNNKAALRGAGVALLSCNATYTGIVTFTNNSGVSIGRELVNNDREFRGGFLSLTSVGTRFTGGAMFIYKSSIRFGNVSIENNIATYGGGVCVFGSDITFGGLTDFANNYAEYSGGAVYAIDKSQLHFYGTSIFKFNTALNGGGLYLADGSLCYFSTTALQQYVQNYAKKNGGAIYVSDTTPSVYCDDNSESEDLKTLCFFQVQADRRLFFKSDLQTRISFENNTANVEGGDLYGGTVDRCKLTNIVICQTFCEFQSSGEVFNTMTIGELDISSVPVNVCRCEHQTPDCSQPPSIELYPGENVDVFVTVFGQRNATVPAVIQTQVSDNFQIHELQDTQRTIQSQLCSELTFTVFSAESESGNLTLSIDSPCDQNSLTIQIIMQECPHGFQLSTSTNTCICDERMTTVLRFTERCDIGTGIVRPNGSEFWVGYDTDSNSLIFHPQCPFDYCTEVEQVVQVNDSDTQCNYNRTGKLCGGCSGTTSLVLGSSRCMQCSNSYLSLIIPFALAGIALVFFLFILKLTVAVGTINGLIFYANLVQVNSSIVYKSVNTNILTVFISWLNLDFGIETCFYNGMDVYTKTWLQFVFPVYVWLLVGIIILISHFSQKITKLLGSNPIAVLATLFLLSYAKFHHTIIAALSCRFLEYPDGYTAVWAYDGNIEYLSGKHTPLFITALLALIFLFLPFTMLLFLGQWLQMLQAKTEWRILSWINKPTFRAFLDAYYAPYACSHRYWTGLLLMVRCILFIIIAVPSTGGSRADLFAVSSAVIGLITFALAAGIYRKRYFGILEASFFLNLALLATATNRIQAAGGNQAAVTLTSLSIAFTTFAGIVIYHIFLQIRNTTMWLRVSSIYKNRFSKQRNDIEEDSEEEIENHEASVGTTIVELREPLLDDM